MRLDDVRDLYAYLRTLPPVRGKARRHDLSFPFNVRRLLGGWKLLFLHGGPYEPDPSRSAAVRHATPCRMPIRLKSIARGSAAVSR
jgi:hypothetical protein